MMKQSSGEVEGDGGESGKVEERRGVDQCRRDRRGEK